MPPHVASQRYLSTRGGSYDLSFEDVVLKGLASDGGLFIPEEIPQLPSDWQSKWANHSFQELAHEIFSLYISPDEIPTDDLKTIVDKSYASFRAPEITPLVALNQGKKLHLLELFHGPTFAFKDVALQFLGNLFEYFLVRRNKGKEGKNRDHLTVIGATSGDTGSAAIYGLRGKKDVSVFILYPQGKVSPVQESQMTTVPDANVHCVAVKGTFDDCQDIVKTLFADEEINQTHRLAAVNSINWARILAQITYYFHAYFALCRQSCAPPSIRFVVPTGNFGDILAGYFATRMGLPVEKLVVATNSNDILHRFWQTGSYEKQPVHGRGANGGLPEDGARAHPDGVKETCSPAMDILVSSNFERLLWFLVYRNSATPETNRRRMEAGEQVKAWLATLKSHGGFTVNEHILTAAQECCESERVSDEETLARIHHTHLASLPVALSESALFTRGTQTHGHYILDPHSAVGVEAAERSIRRSSAHHVALATAHPAKFSAAVEKALHAVEGFDFAAVLPDAFRGLEDMEKRMEKSGNDWTEVRKIIVRTVEKS